MAGEAPADAPAEEEREVEPGSVLGGYRIQGLLGRTAWASTYAAHAGETEVAIKLAASDATDELMVDLRMLRDEFRSPPGSLEAVEEGRDAESGRPFFVTELCSHPSLADLVSVCPLTPDEVVGLVSSLAKALAPLHEAGAGHLAIKPTNIFVGPPPDHDVRIGDLGADLFRRVSRSQHGWLAPEQLGESPTGDPRTDVFAMGLIAFYALTGSTYWSCSDDEALVEEMRGPRMAPSLRARDVGVELDAALDVVLLRALSADAGARFASARAFADALAVHGEATVGIPHEEAAPPKPPPPPPSERHIKATAKLVRFEVPNPKPIPNLTVKMPKAEVTPRPAPTATALMPRAMVPATPATPATPRGVRRFEMPEPPAPAGVPLPAPGEDLVSRLRARLGSRARLIAFAVAGVVVAGLLLTLVLARC